MSRLVFMITGLLYIYVFSNECPPFPPFFFLWSLIGSSVPGKFIPNVHGGFNFEMHWTRSYDSSEVTFIGCSGSEGFGIKNNFLTIHLKEY